MNNDNGDRLGEGSGQPEMGSDRVAVAEGRSSVHTQPKRSSSLLRNQALFFEVFTNHLLLDKIIGYAVRDGGNLSSGTACSLRLIGKSWNDTVIKVLHNNNEALFKVSALRLPEISRFIKIFASSTRVNGCIPSFSLLIRHPGPEIVEELSNLLTSCGEGLIELEFWINAMGNPFQADFPNWPLSRLSKLKLTLVASQSSAQGGRASFGQDGKPGTLGICLIKAALRSATVLSKFHMTVWSDLGPLSPPFYTSSFFESVVLPSTISNFTLVGVMSNSDLEMLARLRLPSLTSFSWFGTYHLLFPTAEPLLRILDNYRASLKTLLIQGNSFPSQSCNATGVRFPVMEHLEQFSMVRIPLELDNSRYSLQTFFPKLSTLRLNVQTPAMLQKWIGYSKFISVTSLEFCLVRDSAPLGDNFRCVKSLDMQTMQSVNMAFPNVRKLEIGLSGRDTSGLEYLFKEMTQLTDLKLSYYETNSDINSDFWDSVLTGLPLETVAGPRDDPGFWQRSELSEEGACSIKNLQELSSLNLCDEQYAFGSFADPRLVHFISDMTFRFVLLKMPKLRKLYLRGRFFASGEMTEEWENEGRSLVYKLYEI